jgi:hypothetical protein
MASLQHHFVAGIRANKEVESELGNGRFQSLHMSQADQDWCGPWSLIQAAVLLQGWRRTVVANPKTERDPWRTFWNRVRTDYNDGADESDLTTLAELLAPWIQIEVMRTTSARRIGQVAAVAIESGHVPILRSTTARWSHFSMVSGLAVGADGAPTALLLLDTSLDAPWAVPYNASQELRPSKPAKAEFRYECRTLDGSRWRARFNSLCIVRRGPGSTQ